MPLLIQSLFAIAILAAIFMVVLLVRGETMASRRAVQRAVYVMVGSAILGGLLQMYVREQR